MDPSEEGVEAHTDQHRDRVVGVVERVVVGSQGLGCAS